MEKKAFKAESQRLLDLMIHSIYTHKEIFLREIISNASDAIDKLCYLSLTDEKVGLKREDFAITLSIDKENRTLTVSDNGIGTGGIMAFTMSVDDFVVSYFTAGTTSQPLSVVIYSMTRHRMTPKINAVSTLLFLFVLVLLIVINVRQSRDEKRREAARREAAS